LGERIPLRTGLAAGSPVQLAIRPHRISLPPNRTEIAGRLVHSENLGSDLLLHLEVNGCNDRVVVRTDSSRAAAWQIGGIVPIALQLTAVLVFDTDGHRVPTTGAGVP
jgi:multiple sugar transport system ATP-binding protein